MLKLGLGLSQSLRRAGVLAVVLGLSACATVTTEYQYAPPQDPAGQTCVLSCKNSMRQCQKLCTPDDPACDCSADYRACYQLCGGEVTSHRVW